MTTPQDQITKITADISKAQADLADVNAQLADIAAQAAALGAAWPAPPSPPPPPSAPTPVSALITDVTTKQDAGIYGMPAGWDPNMTPIIKYAVQPAGKTATSPHGIAAFSSAAQKSVNARFRITNYRAFSFNPATGAWAQLDYSAWAPWEGYFRAADFTDAGGTPSRRTEPGGWSWLIPPAGQLLHYVPGAHPALAPGLGLLCVADAAIIADNPALPFSCDPLIGGVGSDVRNTPTSTETPPVPAMVLGASRFVTTTPRRLYACTVPVASLTAHPPAL